MEDGESQGAQNSSSNPRAVHWPGLGEACGTSPALPRCRRRQVLPGFPRDKGPVTEHRVGDRKWSKCWANVFLSFLIPKCYFSSPEFKLLLPFNIIFGNIIKSHREENAAHSENINNFKKKHIVTCFDSPHGAFHQDTPSPWSSLVEEDVPCN